MNAIDWIVIAGRVAAVAWIVWYFFLATRGEATAVAAAGGPQQVVVTVRGVQKMIEEDRYCVDVMTQISSVHEALRAVGRELMRDHLEHCATTAIRAGEAEANAMYDELVDLTHRHSRWRRGRRYLSGIGTTAANGA